MQRQCPVQEVTKVVSLCKSDLVDILIHLKVNGYTFRESYLAFFILASFPTDGQLLKENVSYRGVFSPLGVVPIFEGFIVRKSKYEAIKVISICKQKMEKRAGIPFNLHM